MSYRLVRKQVTPKLPSNPRNTLEPMMLHIPGPYSRILSMSTDGAFPRGTIEFLLVEDSAIQEVYERQLKDHQDGFDAKEPVYGYAIVLIWPKDHEEMSDNPLAQLRLLGESSVGNKRCYILACDKGQGGLLGMFGNMLGWG